MKTASLLVLSLLGLMWFQLSPGCSHEGLYSVAPLQVERAHTAPGEVLLPAGPVCVLALPVQVALVAYCQVSLPPLPHARFTVSKRGPPSLLT